MEKKISRIRQILLYIYITAVAACILCAILEGQTGETPGEIIYNKNHQTIE